MSVNIIKLCVGADSVEDLAGWQKARIAAQRKAGEAPRQFHATRHMPKRWQELRNGGSLYWVIKGIILVRQRIVGFDEGRKTDGTACCLILLDQRRHLVRPTPRRAFQGWRYLKPEDAPADLAAAHGAGISALPPKMRKDLAELGLL